MVARAFEHRARRIDAQGLLGIPVVPVGLSPADPVFGYWGKGPTLAFRTAVYNLKPVFVSAPAAPKPSPLHWIFSSALLRIAPSFWIIPHQIYEGGPCDEE